MKNSCVPSVASEQNSSGALMKRVMAVAVISLLYPLLSLIVPHLFAARAQTIQYLVLTQASGEISRFALTDAPVITFADGHLVVTCGEMTLTTSMEGLKTSFEDASTSIVPPPIGGARGGQAPTFSFAHSTFEGLKGGDTVNIYTLDGKKIGSTKANGEGRATIDLTPFGRGVYILRTPTVSIKIEN